MPICYGLTLHRYRDVHIRIHVLRTCKIDAHWCVKTVVLCLLKLIGFALLFMIVIWTRIYMQKDTNHVKKKLIGEYVYERCI